jgi:uncharacterized membrane protein (DUF441 family)
VRQPDPTARLFARAAAPIVDRVTPWIDNVSIRVENGILFISGAIVFDAPLADGRPLPPLPGDWRQSGSVYVAMLVVFCCAWVIPSGFRLWRWAALPPALLVLTALASIALTAEVQRAALDTIGSGALRDVALADTPQNRELLLSLERRLYLLRSTCAFLDAGGRLGLAMLIGLAAAWLPMRGLPERKASQ